MRNPFSVQPLPPGVNLRIRPHTQMPTWVGEVTSPGRLHRVRVGHGEGLTVRSAGRRAVRNYWRRQRRDARIDAAVKALTSRADGDRT